MTLVVLSQSSRGAELELRTGGFYAVHEADGSVRLFVPGFDTPDDANEPALPLRRALVDAVVGRRVELVSSAARDLVAYGGLTPAAVGVAEIEVSRQGAIRGARRRQGGTEVVLLPQRGIGEPGVAMPSSWTRDARGVIGACRIRAHPGEKGAGPTLEAALKHAKCVAVWASGAGIKALVMGIPVFYSFPQWIAGGACRPLKEWAAGPLRDDEARLEMFRRLAWANWSMAEIESGEAFRSLLSL